MILRDKKKYFCSGCWSHLENLGGSCKLVCVCTFVILIYIGDRSVVIIRADVLLFVRRWGGGGGEQKRKEM